MHAHTTSPLTLHLAFGIARPMKLVPEALAYPIPGVFPHTPWHCSPGFHTPFLFSHPSNHGRRMGLLLFSAGKSDWMGILRRRSLSQLCGCSFNPLRGPEAKKTREEGPELLVHKLPWFSILDYRKVSPLEKKIDACSPMNKGNDSKRFVPRVFPGMGFRRKIPDHNGLFLEKLTFLDFCPKGIEEVLRRFELV